MNTTPFVSNYGTNTSVLSADITSFLTGTTANPVPATGSYARYQKIGSLVNVEFKYIFASTITTGNIRINLPIPINSNYPKPQSVAHIRYSGTGTGQVHICLYNEVSASVIAVVAQTTFGGVPANFTSASPNAGLGTNDIFTGVIIYETN